MLDTELSETALLKHSYLTILPLMIKGLKISLRKCGKSKSLARNVLLTFGYL